MRKEAPLRRPVSVRTGTAGAAGGGATTEDDAGADAVAGIEEGAGAWPL